MYVNGQLTEEFTIVTKTPFLIKSPPFKVSTYLESIKNNFCSSENNKFTTKSIRVKKRMKWYSGSRNGGFVIIVNLVNVGNFVTV